VVVVFTVAGNATGKGRGCQLSQREGLVMKGITDTDRQQAHQRLDRVVPIEDGRVYTVFLPQYLANKLERYRADGNLSAGEAIDLIVDTHLEQNK
jgi:hypothetical protein